MHNTTTHNLRKSVTSHNVAELAGVSQSAVSRSFTPGASVAEATRLKVLQAAKRLGYLPNLHARTLITGRTRIVGVVLAHLDNLFYPRFLQLLSEQLQTQGMQVMLFIAEGQGNDNLLEHMLQYRVDAIVLAATSLSSSLGKACLQAGIPVVMFNRVSAQSSDRSFHSVRTDQEEGARQIALHLIAGDHERIAYVAGHLDASTNQERENGFRTTLAEQGKAVFAYGVGKYDAATAQAVVRSWYLNRSGQPRPLSLCPDAIFAADDQMALAIMDTLRDELHLRVPAQVSVAGFDDVPQASASAYGLTTYAQPLGPMVQELVELLMAQIAQRNEPMASNKKNKGHATVVPGQLIVRTSTRQPI